MNISYRILAVVAGMLLVSSQVYADKNPTDQPAPSTYRIGASCLPATAATDLDFNNVRARINTGGDMWWDLQGNAEYEIPAGTNKTSMFSASLWIGGVDVNQQLKLAALRYRQVGNDYWPGPLTTDGTAAVDADVCDEYDKHFIVTKQEVNEFLGWYKDPASNPGYQIPNSILDYPAHGDISKGQSFYLAPFFDVEEDGTYDPEEDGDYPYYDFDNSLCNTPDPTAEGNGILADQVLKGDKTIWWVFNDKGNVHTETGGAPIGLEIRAQAFAFATNDAINNMTFYSYEIINRSTFQLTETFFSQWVDTDLGFADDDYVGCDVGRGLGYCYNGTDVDGTSQAWSYGSQPPAIGVDFFQGPYMDEDQIDNPKFDANGDQVVDESINGVNFGNGIVDDERFGMRRFVYHNNSNSGVPQYMTDPEIASEYYNFLRGIWKDGTKMLYGGNAHISSGAQAGLECDFMFPDETDIWNWGTGEQIPTNKEWTEITAGNQPQDRRFMQSAGPFTLKAGAVNYITVGIPWARAASGGAWASVQLLRKVDDLCQSLFDNCFKIVEGPDAPDVVIQELDRELILYISNRKDNSNYNEDYSVIDPTIVGDSTLDNTYDFEGYQIFQLSDASVSISELYDPDKSRLVAQCDLKNSDESGNDISKLINYIKDENLGALVPYEMVNGANEGIFHTLKVTEDLFAAGDKRLVNNKKYYYLAIAYSHNQYKPYVQDDPNFSDGQKQPYLPSRKNQSGGSIVPAIGIPHIPAPEADGTIINAEFGDGPKITRVEGNGNGGNILELTQESIDEILQPPYRANEITYENGFGPVQVKVIDPLNVKATNYTLKFTNVYNHVNERVSKIADIVGEGDTASVFSGQWELIDEADGTVYNSQLDIHRGNEQLFLDLGLSININSVYNPGLYTVGNAFDGAEIQTVIAKDNGLLGSSIEFADSSKLWIRGVPDNDASIAANWIRSGTRVDETEPTNNDYDLAGVSAGNGIDPEEYYEKVLGGTWAPYRLGSKYENGPTNGFLLTQNKLSNIASVNIVITPDKSKWSRCPVIEISEDNVLTEGNARKFELRAGSSVDKEGNPDGTGTGMGWFPGYAINLETGERLNMMFAEDSWLQGENGRDMIWNPTSSYFTPLGDVLFGGKHFIYVFAHLDDEFIADNRSPIYDEGAWAHNKLTVGGNTNKRIVYSQVMWTSIPIVSPEFQFTDPANIPTDVTVKIRISKPYQPYFSTKYYGAANPQNDNNPMYRFSTEDIATTKQDNPTAETALDLIRVVPNPYYAYSDYEENQLDNRVKITNLPERCTISIFTVNGTMIRQFTKDETNTFIDWDLKNHAGIPISGGMYLIHISADGIGEKTVKWFGSLRPIDLNAF